MEEFCPFFRFPDPEDSSLVGNFKFGREIPLIRNIMVPENFSDCCKFFMFFFFFYCGRRDVSKISSNESMVQVVERYFFAAISMRSLEV